jgi:hypothetical protein
MRSLQVEFARPGVLMARLLWSAAVVMSLVAGVLAWKAFEVERDVARAKRDRDELQAKLVALRSGAVQASAPRPEPPYQRDAETVVRMANFDSAAVLRALENVRVTGARITALELAAIDGTARVELELSDPDALLRYLAELNAGEPVPPWSIVRNQGAGPSSPATATLVGNFKPAGGRER